MPPTSSSRPSGLEPTRGSAPSPASPEERVRVEVAGDLQSLRGCRWLNDPPQGDATLNAEKAKLVAQVLYDRWFPQVPVNMAREAVQIDPTTFMVTWAARLSDVVLTGDRAMALISAVDGSPLSYAQYVAVNRPQPSEIPVTAQQAVKVAGEALAHSPQSSIKVTGARAVLVLSAPQSRTGEPLWFVDFMFAAPAGGQAPPRPYHVAVNANTGKVETDLIEVFSIDSSPS